MSDPNAHATPAGEDRLLDEVEAWLTLVGGVQPNYRSQVEDWLARLCARVRDAEQVIGWLREHYDSADFDYGADGEKRSVIAFAIPRTARVSSDFDATLKALVAGASPEAGR